MLIKKSVLDGIAAGKLDLAFRKWERARVKKGTKLRTVVGVLEVDGIDVVPESKLTEREARRAGYESRNELLASLGSRPRGQIYRVTLRFAGADPRIALRNKARLTKAEVHELRERLAKMDSRSPHGPWTQKVLAIIQEHPGVRAPDLAKKIHRDRLPFKRDVRKLKELGLTESLEIGYRLSPRGKALIADWEK